MKKIWKMASLKSKIALSFYLISIVAAIVGCFFLKSEMRIICWACITIVWSINYLVLLEENNKLRKEQYAKDYEIDSLKWSYMRMGRYIYEFHIDELSDIDFRIENELRDIEIRKQNLME